MFVIPPNEYNSIFNYFWLMISFGELCHLFKKKEDYEVPQNQQEAQ